MSKKKKRKKTLKEMGFRPAPGRPSGTTLDDLVQKIQKSNLKPAPTPRADHPSAASDDGLSRKTGRGFEMYYDGKWREGYAKDVQED